MKKQNKYYSMQAFETLEVKKKEQMTALQINAKETKRTKTMYGNRNLHLYGWVIHNQNLFGIENNTCLRNIMVDQYKHKEKKRVKYKDETKGTLGTDISQKVATKDIKSCRMKEDIIR